MSEKLSESKLEETEDDHGESHPKIDELGVPMLSREKLMLNRLKLLRQPDEKGFLTMIKRAKEEYSSFEKWLNGEVPFGHLQVLIKGKKYICIQQYNPTDVIGGVSFLVDYPSDHVLEFWRYGESERDKTPLFRCPISAIGMHTREFRNGRKIWVNITRTPTGIPLVCFGFNVIEDAFCLQQDTDNKGEKAKAFVARAMGFFSVMILWMKLNWRTVAVVIIFSVMAGWIFHLYKERNYTAYNARDVPISNNGAQERHIAVHTDQTGSVSNHQPADLGSVQKQNAPDKPSVRTAASKKKQPTAEVNSKFENQLPVLGNTDLTQMRRWAEIRTYRLAVDDKSKEFTSELLILQSKVATTLQGNGFKVIEGDGPLGEGEAKITLGYHPLPNCDGGFVIARIEDQHGSLGENGYSCPSMHETIKLNFLQQASVFIAESIKQNVSNANKSMKEELAKTTVGSAGE